MHALRAHHKTSHNVIYFDLYLLILNVVLMYFHGFHWFIDFNYHFGVFFIVFIYLLILTVILVYFHCYIDFFYCHLVYFHVLLNFNWHFGVIFMIFIYFTYFSSKSQNLTILSKNMKILHFEIIDISRIVNPL